MIRHPRLLAAALLAAAPLAAQSATDAAPPVRREFRGVWVASVANIDWPSRPGLSTWEQQEELLHVLNRCVALGLNAVVLQIRPAADALYASTLEPWSEYLTGRQGQAPEPAWDPLAFAVEEAHRRGLELHAWFNPFRARHPTATSEIAATHVAKRRPTLVLSYGRHLWLDPGLPEARAYSIRVIADVVRRYDIDGVQIDDYFYPYRERDSSGALLDFPDSLSWARYVGTGGALGRDDWRRSNVDVFVRDLYRAIKRTKRRVRFGVSPFGIWRPGYPATVQGFDPYEQIYADARKWLVEGWVDYFAPQLYWPIQPPAQSYPVLLAWWAQENVKRRHLWPGNFTSRVGAGDSTRRWTPAEILDQVRLTRERAGATGNIHFSMKVFLENRDSIATALARGIYAEPALVPRTPWLDSVPPRRPIIAARIDSTTGGVTLRMRPGGKEAIWRWVVRARTNGAWTTRILPGWQRSHALTLDAGTPVPDAVLVSAVDRLGNETRAVRPRLPARGTTATAP
ncbi:MAG: glycoside hydrolase family 10 protein [Gemmatimonadaceae bacterium]